MTILQLGRERVLEGSRFPVSVNAATTVQATPRVAVHCTKLMYVAAGSSRLTHESGDVEVFPGDLVAIPDGYWCAGAPEQSVQTLTVYVDTTYLMQQAFWLQSFRQVLIGLELFEPTVKTLHVLSLAPGRAQHIEMLLRVLSAMQSSCDQDFIFMARLAELFGDLGAAVSRNAGMQLAGAAWRTRHLERAVVLLHDQLERPWMIAELADEVGLSSSQLTRVFRAGLDTTPAEYLCRIRVEEMARLLLTTNFGVAEAARQVGWREVSHAARAFKRYHGVAPSRYF